MFSGVSSDLRRRLVVKKVFLGEAGLSSVGDTRISVRLLVRVNILSSGIVMAAARMAFSPGAEKNNEKTF